MGEEQEIDAFNEDELANIFDDACDDSSDEDTVVASLLDLSDEKEERYQDFKFIAEGGMKRVYEVFDLKLGRYVAMAKLKPDSDESFHEPFVREAKLTALLDHPNVISVFDVGVDVDERPYFTMDLKSGESLEQRVARFHMDEDGLSLRHLHELLEVFMKICDGVSHAHARGILHLDLKPSNVLVGDYGDVVVCDWGLGRMGTQVFEDLRHENDVNHHQLHHDLLNTLCLSDAIKGTLGFMAPEQAKGSKDLDEKADVYALGALLYHILCNSITIDRKDKQTEEIIEEIKMGKVVDPRLRFPKKMIPMALAAVAMKALAKDSKDRHATVDDLREDVHQYLLGYSTSAEETGFIKEWVLFYRRNLAICHVLLIAGLTVCTMLVAFLVHQRHSMTALELSRDEYLKEAERANRALSMYRREKNWNQDFLEDNWSEANDYLFDLINVQAFEDPERFQEQAVATLSRMVEAKSSAKWQKSRLGYVYFLQQEFDASLRYFDHADYEKYKTLSHHYAPLVRGDGLLDARDLGDLIDRLDRQSFQQVITAFLMVRFDGIRRSSLADHAHVVKSLLQFFNGEERDLIFEYDVEHQHLRLGGKKLKVFQWRRMDKQLSLLKTLPIKSIDASSSGLEHLRHFHGLSIESLDIRNTPIKSIVKVKEALPSLKRLIVSREQMAFLRTRGVEDIDFIITD